MRRGATDAVMVSCGDAKTRRVRLEGRGSFRAMRQVSSASWSETTIADALVKVRRPKSIPLSQYLSEGCYPVIDQGKNLVAGYTNDESAVIFSPLPITIFGDHTRIVKFSKIPFATGADGTQLLYPKAGIDPTFFYYAIKNIDLSNYFYARHFKYLKASSIQLPLFPVQRQIADILSAYDDLIENNRRRVAILEETARLAFRKWFGGEVGRKSTLDEICHDVRRGVSPDAVAPETPYIGLEHMPRRSIALCEWESAQKVTSTKLAFVAGDILFGKIRPYFHKVGITFVDGVASSDAIVIKPNHPELLAYVLMTVSSDAFVVAASQGMKEGAKMPRADWKQLLQYPVVLPDDKTLAAFNKVLNPILAQLKTLCFSTRKLAAARDMLLPRLMKGLGCETD